MPVERGIAMSSGWIPVAAPRLGIDVPMATAVEGYAAWARLAAEALDGFDALYVHIKGPDVPAHDGRAEDKRDVISAIDRAFFGEVLPRTRPRDRSSPSPPTTRPRASGRRTRPIPSRSW